MPTISQSIIDLPSIIFHEIKKLIHITANDKREIFCNMLLNVILDFFLDFIFYWAASNYTAKI